MLSEIASKFDGQEFDGQALPNLAQTLLEAMPMLVWTCTPEGLCDYLSPQWLAFTGVPLAQQLGFGWLEALHPDDRQRSLAAWENAVLGRARYDLEYRIRRYDGTYRWFKTRGLPQLDSHGAILRWLGTCTDIDDQKTAEERFSGLLASISDAVWIIDRHWRIVFVNCPAAAYANSTPTQIAGRTLWELFPDLKGSRFELEAAHAFETCRGVQYEEFNQSDGRWFEVDIFPDGASIIVFTRDITNRRLLDQKVQQAAKHDSLGILAGGVAHDFNNLLVGIMGNVSLAMDILEDSTPVRPMLQDAVTASERAAQLTRQLLAYAGKGQIKLEELDISELVRETTQLIRAHIPSYVELKLFLDQKLPPVEGDRAQIQQVIMNLVINASESLDASKPGQVRVYTSSGNVAADSGDLAPGRYVTLRVEDDGSGMTSDTASHIFEPFFTTKFTGRGLGLAAVHGIVRTHKGDLRVKSVVGQGSTFTILLPACTDAAS
jgi:PAS domain S-box-containing protein